MELIRTSHPTIRANPSLKGFTLIELLVVVALIGLITTFALPSINSYFKLSLNTVTREMASIIKEAYNAAVITGKVHRVAYDLEQNEFWVESGPASALLDTAETREKEEHRKRFAKKSEPPPSEFSIDKSVTRRKLSLPRGVKFEDIVSEASKQPLTQGIAYTHIFPEGMTEKTLIHLVDSDKHQITLAISPLIGKTQLIERYIKEDEWIGTFLERQ